MAHLWVTSVLALLALVMASAALTLAATVTRRIGNRDPFAVPPIWRRLLRINALPLAAEATFGRPSDKDLRVAFIANPTKPGMSELREQALRACSIRYLPQPIWLYTSPDDPGGSATRNALEAGADVVVAVGGDGTVRAVAAELAGTDTRLGIIPMGTGNIFARNLDLPLADTSALLRTVLEGSETTIDVGWLTMEGIGEEPGSQRHIFLVMGGAGIDAEMVAGADDRLKKRLGWVAYFFAALQHMGERRMSASVSVDGSDAVHGQMRSVLIANVGRLPGGFQLVPDASVSDGHLDIVTLDARAGIVGWTDLFGSVIAQGVGFRQPAVLRAYRASRIDHARGTSVEIEMDHAYKIQVDGEPLGKARKITAVIEPGALTVRVPSAPGPRN